MADAHDYEDHATFEGMAVEHVLGSLSEDDARVFRAHLLQCPQCRARVGELRTIAHELAGVEQAAAREAARVEAPVAAPGAVEAATETAPQRGEPPRAKRADPWRHQAWLVIGLAVAVGAVIALAAWGLALRAQVTDLARDVRIEERAAQVSALGDPWEVQYAADGVDVAVAEDGEVLVVIANGLPDATERLRLLDDGSAPTHDIGVTPDEGSLVRVVASVTCDVEALELLAGETAVVEASRICEDE